MNLNRNSINMDISNKCSLQCPKCDRVYNEEYLTPKQEISLKDFEKVAKYFKNIEICGQVGDSIYHSDLPGILNICKEYNTKIHLHTAAGARKIDWWENIFHISKNIQCEWSFALDGLPKDSSIYRIGQDGEKVFEIMKLGCKILGPKKINWRYIIFKYNENDIDESKKLADKYGMNFHLIKSNRWTGTGDLYLPTNPENFVSKFIQ